MKKEKLVNNKFTYKSAKEWIETLMWAIRSSEDNDIIKAFKKI